MSVSPDTTVDLDDELRALAAAEAVNPNKDGNRDVLGREAGHVVRPEDRQPILPETHGLWTGYEDWANCPPNYDVWYRQYLPEAQMWVRKCGVHWSQVDEVVAELMTRFIELDSLGVFRRYWTTKSVTRKSNFRSYFSNYIVSRAPGKHRNNVRYLSHNSFIFDAQVGDDGATWGDLRAPAMDDLAPVSAEFASLIAQVRRTVGNDALVDAVLLLATNDGTVKQSALKASLGVNARVAKTGLDAVRGALRDAMAELA